MSLTQAARQSWRSNPAQCLPQHLASEYPDAIDTKEKFVFTRFRAAFNIQRSTPDRLTRTTVNLRTLEYVVAVADVGHFSRAAERCNVSQPTLSLQIRSLETELGVELFERGSHPVQLTPFGRRLIGLVRITTSDVQKLRNLAQALRGPMRVPAA